MKHRSRSAYLCGCALLTFNITPAMAQDAESRSAAASGDDIIVTARRVEERLQDVPISISVFNEEQLAQRNISAGADLATYTPSLSVNAQFGPDRATFAIRGFVQETNTAPSVGVFFADVVTPRGPQAQVPIGGGAGPGRFFDLQNVQVLKGPQGTLFGRNTTGGSILLVPNRPTSEFSGYVEASVGNYDMQRLQAVVNVPLSDTFRVRAGFDRQKRDGYLKNRSGIGPSRFADIDYWAARVTVEGDLTPDLENSFIVNVIDSDTNGGVQKLVACAPTVMVGFLGCDQLQRSAEAGDGFYDVRQPVQTVNSHSREWQLVNTTKWLASDTLTIKNIASYGQQILDFSHPLYGTDFITPAVPDFGLPSYEFGFLNVTPVRGRHAADQQTFTEELQFQGRSGDDRLTWQAGAYFERSTSLSPASQIAQVLISCTDETNPQCTDILGGLFGAPVGSLQTTIIDTTYQSIGLYGQASYSFTDQLTVTGGLRYTWDKSSVEHISSVTNFAFNTPLAPTCSRTEADANCQSRISQSSDKPTWVIDVAYKPIDGIMVYGKYARGYRTGAITAMLPDAFAVASPEKVDNFELGVKSEFHGSVSGYFNITGYYNNFTNQQLSLSLDDNPVVPGIVPVATGIINAGKSRIYGVEVEAGLRPFDGFNLSASYGYLHTEIREIALPTLTGSPYIINSNIVPGDELLQSPRHKLTATAAYTLPLDEEIGKITFSATYNYASKSRTNYLNRQTLDPGFGTVIGTDLNPVTRDLGIVPSYNLLNLNVDWKRVANTPFDLSLFATNVTKEKFITYTGGLLPTVGFETAALNEPRMYGMRVRYEF